MYEGAGIGLANMGKAAERMGGHAAVRRRRPVRSRHVHMAGEKEAACAASHVLRMPALTMRRRK
jgi:hypothetical protein